MSRPDAALALAALYSSVIRTSARVGAVCVTGSGFGAAVFCDVVARFYQPRVGGSNGVFAVGLATEAAAPDPPMVKTVIERKKDTGEPQYTRSILRLADTSLAEAVIRNGVTLTVQGVIVLSAPATSLARSLELAGSKELYKKRVKRLVIVDTGAPRQDAAAFRKLLVEWPTPVFFVGKDAGESLMFPGANLDKLFGWTPAHPVADAYRAFKPAPYDAPLFDLIALNYALTPDAGLFDVSEPGSLTIGANNIASFAEGNGQVRRISVSAAKKQQALDALITAGTSAPPPPPARGRIGG